MCAHARADGFNDAYRDTPPWDISRPQPGFRALAEDGALHGRVLDVGCGTGEHALLAASLGLDATGIDGAPIAIEKAEAKARERGIDARFLVGDVLELAQTGEQWDTVLDCGVFHVFDDDDRPVYVENLAAVIPAGGRYFMLCFSDRQPGAAGPRRVSQDEIRSSFADGWRVDSIEASVIETNWQERSARAWLATITRM
ncbi:MAG TPA: class I SAM-dependent methyltransferase [Actinomycetota bacterium]|jgi:cyclopropane fatty-acyl-phospholipid synthase-like methyltransferase|nr:class I SAM-dependent methyltransferase [Actinomycetota bacterium]